MQVEANCKMLNKFSKSVLLIYGWKSSSANAQNVAVWMHKWDHRIFLDSYDFSDRPEITTNFIDVVNEASNLANERYDVDICAVVTVNAPNIVSISPKIEYFTRNPPNFRCN